MSVGKQTPQVIVTVLDAYTLHREGFLGVGIYSPLTMHILKIHKKLYDNVIFCGKQCVLREFDRFPSLRQSRTLNAGSD